MKAIILSAGFGTRLKPLTNSVPKVMVKLAGKPILEHQIEPLKQAGITEIGINTHYLPKIITGYFGSGAKYGVNITYSHEPKIMGTSGALNGFRDWIGTDSFLVIYGDVYHKANYQKMIRAFQKSNSDGLLGLIRLDNLAGKGLVKINSKNEIILFKEKPNNPEKYHTNLTNAGIFIFSPKILNSVPLNQSSDFGYDVIPNLINTKNKLYGYIIEELLIDIGTLKAYKNLNKFLSKT